MDFETYYKQLQQGAGSSSGGDGDDGFEEFYNGLKMDLGDMPATMKHKVNREQLPAPDFRKSPLMKQAETFTAAPPPAPEPTITDRLKEAFPLPTYPLEQLSKPAELGKQALNFLGRTSETIAEAMTPDAPLLKRGEPVPGTNARQAFLERSGQKPATKAEMFGASIAAPFFVPGAGLGAGTNLQKGVDMALNATKLQGLARTAASEGLTGATIGFGSEYAQGSNDLGQAGVNAALGGALGAGIPALGKGAQAAKSVLESKLGRPVNATRLGAPESPTLDATPRIGKESDDLVAATQEVYDLPDTSSRIVTKTKQQRMTLNDTKSSAVTNYIDDLYRIKEFGREAEAVTGKKMKAVEDPYTLALNSRGSDIIARQSVTKKLVDSQGNVVGDSLRDVMQGIKKNEITAFEDYLINKHAITRMDRGEKVFPDNMMMTSAKSDMKAKEYEAKFPHFEDTAKKYYAYQEKLTKSWLVDTGLITEQQFAAWKKDNPHYVPNQRQFEPIEMNRGGNRAKGGFLSQKSPVKKYSPTGSERPIISPIESTIENTEKFIKTAKRNEVGKSLLSLLEQGGDELSAFARVKPAEAEFNPFKILQEEGVDGLISRLGDDWMASLENVKTDPNRAATVTVMRDGKPVTIEVFDVPLYEAMSALTPQQQGIVLSVLGKITRWFKMLTTGYNPLFSLTRNVIRDIPTAFINSKTTNNPARFAYDLTDAIVEILASNFKGKGQLYESFKNMGGGHSSSVASNRNLLKQSKRQILPGNTLRNIPDMILEKFENLNNAVESAPRLAEYKRAVKKGGGSIESKVQGLAEANDVTVNFAKRGRYISEADTIFPYLNAAIQGLDKLARTARDNPLEASVKATMAITLPTILLYAMNHDDPNYQQLSDRDKDTYFLFPKDDGTFAKLPKPRELGVPFGNLVERVLRQWWDKDPDAFDDFASTLKTAFTPPGVGAVFNTSLDKGLEEVARDTIAGPIVGMAANRDFADRPIVPGNLQRLSPELQFDERTSEPAKLLGRLTNTSPKQLDYLAKSYTGIIGQLGIPATTKGSSVGDVFSRQVTVDPTYSNDITTDFYRAKEKLDTAQTDFKATGEKGKDFDDSLRKQFGRAEDRMGDLRKKIKKLQTDSGLSKESQQAQIKDLQEQINRIAKDMVNKSK